MKHNAIPSSLSLGYMPSGVTDRQSLWIYRGIIAVLSITLFLQGWKLLAGRGGYLSMQATNQEIQFVREQNAQWVGRNAKIATAVRDISKGREVIESHARFNYLVVKPGEVVYRFSENR